MLFATLRTQFKSGQLDFPGFEPRAWLKLLEIRRTIKLFPASQCVMQVIMMRFMSVTEADIEKALASAARVIDRYGDVYWPLFERLERELEILRARSNKLSAYLQPNAGSTPRHFRRVPPERDVRS